MLRNKSILTGYKLVFGLLGFSALVTEVAVLTERGVFVPANFFSFFTVQSNIIAAATLLISAFTVNQSKALNKKITTLRGAATVYILIVGIGFSLLLAGLDNTQFTAVAWDNIVLHYIMPIALLIDWLIDPPKALPPFSKAIYSLLFPVAYVAYTLIRGPHANWYPYPFLDPATKGYGHIAFTVALLLVLGVILVWALTTIAKRLGAKSPR